MRGEEYFDCVFVVVISFLVESIYLQEGRRRHQNQS